TMQKAWSILPVATSHPARAAVLSIQPKDSPGLRKGLAFVFNRTAAPATFRPDNEKRLYLQVASSGVAWLALVALEAAVVEGPHGEKKTDEGVIEPVGESGGMLGPGGLPERGMPDDKKTILREKAGRRKKVVDRCFEPAKREIRRRIRAR